MPRWKNPLKIAFIWIWYIDGFEEKLSGKKKEEAFDEWMKKWFVDVDAGGM